MEFFPSLDTVVNIGSFSIKWYSIMILIGTVTVYLIVSRQIRKMGYDQELIDEIFMSLFIISFIGARLWYCAFYNLGYYLSNPIEIIRIWDGGLAIQGGVIAGLIGGYFFTKKHKINFFRWADQMVPTILIAQAIGRWGNFFNQEAHGGEVSEAFYTYFPSFIKDNMFIDGAYRLPTFLMESVGNLIGFFLIMCVFKKYATLKRGDLTYAYFMWTGVVRYFVEGFRTDSLMLGDIRMAQLTSIVYIVIGVLGYLGVFRKLIKKKAKPTILYDLDGTLLDTKASILEAYKQLFIKYDKIENFTEERQKEVIGPSLYKMLPLFFPDQDVEKLVAEYKEINLGLHKKLVKSVKNAPEILKYLKNEGYTLGIVSSKNVGSIEKGLEQEGLSQYFDVIVGFDMVENEKPDKEGIVKACKLLNVGLDNTIYIGDTNNDIYAARNAGVFSIGFEGYHVSNFDIAKPNRQMKDHLELIEILKENVEWTYNMM